MKTFLNKEALERGLTCAGLPWAPANSTGIGELAYDIPFSKWCKVRVFTSLNEATGRAKVQPYPATLRLVLLYENGEGRTVPVGGYPKVVRDGRPLVLVMGELIGVARLLISWAIVGMQKDGRCTCGAARTPVYTPMYPGTSGHRGNWSLGRCIHRNCPKFLKKGGRNGQKAAKRAAKTGSGG